MNLLRMFRKELIPVYHMTNPRNAELILKEGLMPLKKSERPQSMQVADEIFSEIGEREFGIVNGRKQIFAWPSFCKIEKDVARARAEWGEQIVLELQIDPEKAKVTQQDCTSVAREIILPAIKRLHEENMAEDREIGCPYPGFNLRNMTGRDIWHWRRETEIASFRNFFADMESNMQRLELLARTYWEIAVPLAGFDDAAMRRMYDEMIKKVSKFSSLHIMGSGGDYTNAEAIVFEDKISRRRITVVKI